MGRPPRVAAPAVFCLLLLAFAAGIWGTYRNTFPGRGLYRVTGVFEARGGRHHEDLLDRAALVRGDRVRLTMRQTPEALRVVEIQKLP